MLLNLVVEYVRWWCLDLQPACRPYYSRPHRPFFSPHQKRSIHLLLLLPPLSSFKTHCDPPVVKFAQPYSVVFSQTSWGSLCVHRMPKHTLDRRETTQAVSANWKSKKGQVVILQWSCCCCGLNVITQDGQILNHGCLRAHSVQPRYWFICIDQPQCVESWALN